MTKDEITKKVISPECIAIYDPILVNVPFAQVYKAMDEWAIEFGKWIWKCDYAPSVEGNTWIYQHPNDDDEKTTEELYLKFIEQQTEDK